MLYSKLSYVVAESTVFCTDCVSFMVSCCCRGIYGTLNVHLVCQGAASNLHFHCTSITCCEVPSIDHSKALSCCTASLGYAPALPTGDAAWLTLVRALGAAVLVACANGTHFVVAPRSQGYAQGPLHGSAALGKAPHPKSPHKVESKPEWDSAGVVNIDHV